jgi:hypothetical protein
LVSTSLPAVRAGGDAGRTGRLGRTFHVEAEFAEKPRERDPRVTFDLDLGPGAGLAVAIDEHRPVLRDRLAGLSRPIESLASEDKQVQMVTFKDELAHNLPKPRGGLGAEVGGGVRNGVSHD